MWSRCARITNRSRHTFTFNNRISSCRISTSIEAFINRRSPTTSHRRRQSPASRVWTTFSKSHENFTQQPQSDDDDDPKFSVDSKAKRKKCEKNLKIGLRENFVKWGKENQTIKNRYFKMMKIYDKKKQKFKWAFWTFTNFPKIVINFQENRRLFAEFRVFVLKNVANDSENSWLSRTLRVLNIKWRHFQNFPPIKLTRNIFRINFHW